MSSLESKIEEPRRSAPAQPDLPNEELWETHDGSVSYRFMAPDGRLFSCEARSLEEARSRRDTWKNMHGYLNDLTQGKQRMMDIITGKTA